MLRKQETEWGSINIDTWELYPGMGCLFFDKVRFSLHNTASTQNLILEKESETETTRV